MRRCLLVACVVAGGCKDKKPAPVTHDDAVVVDLATPPADAPPLIACTPRAGSNVTVRKIGTVAAGAMLATSPPGDGRLFVVEQTGALRIFEQEQLAAAPFLDLSADAGGPVLAGGEQGLLGLAFHPNYAVNRQFYVYYTARNPDQPSDPHNPYIDTVVRYTSSATDPSVADLASATTILTIPDYASNHNGGMLEFGGDGYLYVSTGDGGGGGDPDHNGQNPRTLLGKMLRIDVDHPSNGRPYGIPGDNPFANGVDGAPEVFIIGLRNPWRWSFDRATGDMWIGDVGQGALEEIDVLEAGQQAGKNLGWNLYEGSACYQPAQPCSPEGMTMPVEERAHATGWRAIIGGQVYRGACFPDLQGWYFYDDNNKARLVKARRNPDKTLEIVELPQPVGLWPASPASLHADARGELYLTTTSGDVYAIESGP